MKILIICYCYPPDAGPRAFRWSAIAEHWAKQGMTVHVICGRKFGADSEELLNDVYVHRRGGAFTDNLRARIEQKKRNNKTSDQSHYVLPDHKSQIPSKNYAIKALKRLHDITWKKVYWPESTCLWYFPANKVAKQLLTDIEFDAVISSSTPYTGHLVGHAVKRRNPDIHWMVDIGDPFSFHHHMPWNNETLYRGRNYRSEELVLRDADSVSVTIESCLQEYIETFPNVDIESKSIVLPPLLSAVSHLRKKPETANRNGRRFVFTGALYKSIRNPTFLLNLFSRICEQHQEDELHFFGSINDCGSILSTFKSLLGKNLFVHGPVDRERALDEIAAADVLVNIGNDTPFQIPSKIIDYIATGRPIINLVTIDNDSSQHVLCDYPAHLNVRVTGDGPTLTEVDRVQRFLEDTNMAPQLFLDKFLYHFQVEAIAESYLSAVTKGKPGS